MNDEEKLAIENLKRLSETKPFIIWVDGTPYNKSNQIYTILNLIEKQDKIIQAMAGEIAQFRNECDLENDTKETVIEEYEEQYIIWRKFFKESR